MIRREHDPDFVNRIVNDPAVLPFFDLGGRGELDMTPCVLADRDYIFLSNGEDALSLWEWSAPGVWEGHSLFLPSARGKKAVQAGRAMVEWMLDNDARLLFGLTPIRMRHAMAYNRMIGFKQVDQRDHNILGHVAVFELRA
jgi:hypothetical protein